MTDRNTSTGRHHAEDAPAPTDTEKDPKHTADRNDRNDRKNRDATGDTDDTGVPQQGPGTVEEIIDEWGEETFPASDPPANY